MKPALRMSADRPLISRSSQFVIYANRADWKELEQIFTSGVLGWWDLKQTPCGTEGALAACWCQSGCRAAMTPARLWLVLDNARNNNHTCTRTHTLYQACVPPTTKGLSRGRDKTKHVNLSVVCHARHSLHPGHVTHHGWILAKLIGRFCRKQVVVPVVYRWTCPAQLMIRWMRRSVKFL